MGARELVPGGWARWIHRIRAGATTPGRRPRRGTPPGRAPPVAGWQAARSWPGRTRRTTRARSRATLDPARRGTWSRPGPPPALEARRSCSSSGAARVSSGVHPRLDFLGGRYNPLFINGLRGCSFVCQPKLPAEPVCESGLRVTRSFLDFPPFGRWSCFDSRAFVPSPIRLPEPVPAMSAVQCSSRLPAAGRAHYGRRRFRGDLRGLHFRQAR